MKFLIITHVPHIQKNDKYYGYTPYIKEMNIWLKYVNYVTVVAPLQSQNKDTLQSPYIHNSVNFTAVNEFNIKTLKSIFKTLIVIPKLMYLIFKAMKTADHIHIRSPGNMGLLGAIIQIFFPNTPKTAKYAGNWDSKSKQPLSYKFQKWILSNTILTKNMQVLVYGEWENQSKNIKPFFTASYSNSEIKEVAVRNIENNSVIKFLFVGTLSTGKQPLFAVQIIENLQKNGINAILELYGEGKERSSLENYIQSNNLSKFISIKGNHNSNSIKEQYQKSHFLILPSKSEGWPKVVAEAMFWGCLPIATPVSCVAQMLDYENRGLLLQENLKFDTQKIQFLLQNNQIYSEKVKNAISWSRQYTTELFEEELIKILK